MKDASQATQQASEIASKQADKADAVVLEAQAALEVIKQRNNGRNY